MSVSKLFRMLAASVVLVASASAHAGYVYVGSWHVGDGPQWSAATQPAYSGVEAAALLFGGNASDYAISTVSSNVSDINFSAWMDGYAIGITAPLAQNYENGDWYTWGVRSAYILDNSCFNRYNDPSSSCQDGYINYAFRVDSQDVPEPASIALLGLGLAGFGAARRRSKKA